MALTERADFLFFLGIGTSSDPSSLASTAMWAVEEVVMSVPRMDRMVVLLRCADLSGPFFDCAAAWLSLRAVATALTAFKGFEKTVGRGELGFKLSNVSLMQFATAFMRLPATLETVPLLSSASSRVGSRVDRDDKKRGNSSISRD